MANAGETLRLAVGIFYEPSRLDRAVAELFSGGIGVQDLCLVGTPSALQAVKRSDADAASDAPAGALSGCQLHNLGHLIEGCEVSASSGPLLRTLLKHAKWNKHDRRLTADWLWPELCTRLSDHIRQGALVLMVSTPTFASQHTCSRTLLRHSAHTVQTHEFMPLK
jgi:hypothetical protein